jgi:hypothetical protein
MPTATSRIAILALLAAVSSAGAVDYPVYGKSLSVRRTGKGTEKLTFVAVDANLPLPLAGSLADPLTDSAGGAFVDVVASGSPAVAALAVPWGAPTDDDPGWVAAPGELEYKNREAPAGESVVKSFLLKEGKRLKVNARRAGLALEGTEGVVGVRVTFGKGTPDEVRICAQFDVATDDEPGKFVAKKAPATALPDCSDASLGTYGTPYEEIPLNAATCGPTFDDLGHSTAPGSDLHRVTLHDARAVCNDGTPAVFYIRPATPGGGHEDDWLIWLEGGGSCDDPVNCGARWCGIGSESSYGAAKMSSRFTYPVIKGNGIFSQTNGANNFRDFNMVVGFYCSSDNWVGRHTVDVDPEGPLPTGYRIAFHGHYIVDAMLAKLRSGVTSDEGDVTLPPIDASANVLFTGTSGGGYGAIVNIDYVAAWAADVPVASFKAAVDARVSALADDTTLLSDAVKEAILAGGEARRVFRDDFQDESCLEHHALDDPRLCADASHVLLHHVAEPMFIHQDLADPVLGFAPYPSMAEWTHATRTLLETQFLQRPSLIEEAALATEPLPVILAPLCGDHVGLESGAFYDNEVQLLPSTARDINTHLYDWYTGGMPASLIDGAGGATTTHCAP